jgi:hypothetical protein
VSPIPLQRKRIAVFPASRWQAESRLLASLAELYPVDFLRGNDIAWQSMDAAIFFPEAWGLSEAIFERGVSSFRFACPGRGITLAPKASITFSHDAVLHPAFRGAQMPVGRETDIGELSTSDPEVPLAHYGTATVWQFRAEGRAELHTSAVAPPELRGEQLLWSWLRPDNWVALFPLMHFLRRVTLKTDWSPPPTRACFMFDDPNLHSLRYGHLNFPRVARECLAHTYHVAVATIPLDTWYAAPAAVALFRRNRECLSLLIHGNDHIANELARERSSEEALRVLAQALKRVDRFERRTGLTVGRIIAPPHGGCSESTLAQMVRLPYEGVCTSVGSLAHSYQGSFPIHFGLSPVSFLGGVPTLRRWDLHYGLAPLRIAAFLGQPIIPYGHHQDCAGGVEVLAKVADTVNSWGPTRWTDPVSILRGQYRTKRDGELLHVQMWSRRVQVRVPEGVSYLIVHVPFRNDASVVCEVAGTCGFANSEACAAGVPVRVVPSTMLGISISSHRAVDPANVGRPRYRVWPAIRRTLTIGRDRLTPILWSVRSSTATGISAEALDNGQRLRLGADWLGESHKL